MRKQGWKWRLKLRLVLLGFNGCTGMKHDSLTALAAYFILFFSRFFHIFFQTTELILAQSRGLVALNLRRPAIQVSVFPM
jgi:hypothetical protein